MIKARKTAVGTRYDVRLRDPDGREYSRTFNTKREAQAFDARERADRSRGGWVDPRKSATTFDELATEWIGASPAKRPSAWARDESIIRLHLRPTLGRRPLATITRRDVQALVNAWSAKRAPRTVRRQYGVLRAILNAAVANDLIARSPCQGIKLPQVHPGERHVVDAEELAALADALGEDYSPMVYLGAVLGLRWGECAGLRVGRLDLLRFTLAVAWQRTRGIGGATVEGPPKSDAGRRTLAVPAELIAMLADHLARQGLTAADAEAWVFTAPNGGPLEYAHFRHRVWLPATRSAGLKGLQFHDLRRANATGLVDEGVDLKTAQTRLGHFDPRLTLAVYAQAVSASDHDAAARLGGRFMTASRGHSHGGSRDGRGMGSSAKKARRPRKAPDQPFRPSGRRDLNPRPQRPERCALPSCATSRVERPMVPVAGEGGEVPEFACTSGPGSRRGARENGPNSGRQSATGLCQAISVNRAKSVSALII